MKDVAQDLIATGKRELVSLSARDRSL